MGSLSPRQSAKSKLALLHMSYSISYCTLFLNYCSCFVALRDFEMEADEEAKRAAKAAERDRKRAEKEAEEEAQRAAKAAQRDAKWTADVDPTIERMIGGCSYYSDIAFRRKVIFSLVVISSLNRLRIYDTQSLGSKMSL